MGPPLNHKRYEQHFEYMFIFTIGKIKIFNPIKEGKTWKDNRKNKCFRRNIDGSFDRGYAKSQSSEKVKGNVWTYSVGGGLTTKDKINHPAMFPEKLANDHIKSWSNVGDVILDPMMGSCTTGICCKKLSRNFIGIEIVKEYFDIAKNRIENYMPLFNGENK